MKQLDDQTERSNTHRIGDPKERLEKVLGKKLAKK